MSKLSELLYSYELRRSVELMNLIDESGYTLLHSAAFYNSYKIADFLIQFFTKKLNRLLE